MPGEVLTARPRAAKLSPSFDYRRGNRSGFVEPPTAARGFFWFGMLLGSMILLVRPEIVDSKIHFSRIARSNHPARIRR